MIEALPSALLNVPGRVGSLAGAGEAKEQLRIISALISVGPEVGENREKQ